MIEKIAGIIFYLGRQFIVWLCKCKASYFRQRCWFLLFTVGLQIQRMLWQTRNC